MRVIWITSIIGIILASFSVYGILNKENNFLFSKSEITKDIEKIGDQVFSIPNEDFDLRVFLPSPLVFDRDESGVDSTQTNNSTSQINQVNIVYHTNLNRQSEGFSILNQNTRLESSAQKKAQDMLDRQYFEHDSPDGIGVADLAEDSGYEYIVVGENLARGDFKTADEVVLAWMNSPAHRENIMNSKYTDIGIGIVYGRYDGSDVWILVQHFGASIDTCPKIDSSLELKIEDEQTVIDSLENDIYKKLDEINSTNKWSSGYNDLVEEYNALISEFNSKVVAIKEDIALYNEGVVLFNACVSS
ncbi:MAG: hypothetical protein KBD26_01680 [Candidatus Pacebacteria bacterium]|nr:hypothetical protein [Candidatus Paceibacterota bacterium]MBP9772521.1 hypothetical protein [Candidatus Paceibacterota bacterium]